MSRKLRLPGPAMVVALLALFVALSGTAVAAGVPALAKRALVADNAKKLSGKTSAQLLAAASATSKSQADAAGQAAAAAPGPASTVAGLAVIKSAAVGQLNPGQIREFSISCDAGQQVVGGGLSSDALMVIFDSFPSNATTWTASGGNIFGGSPPASVSIWAVCMK
jgi:hypothetical protein